jgi:hypothetical protein
MASRAQIAKAKSCKTRVFNISKAETGVHTGPSREAISGASAHLSVLYVQYVWPRPRPLDLRFYCVYRSTCAVTVRGGVRGAPAPPRPSPLPGLAPPPATATGRAGSARPPASQKK